MVLSNYAEWKNLDQKRVYIVWFYMKFLKARNNFSDTKQISFSWGQGSWDYKRKWNFVWEIVVELCLPPTRQQSVLTSGTTYLEGGCMQI